MTIGLQQYYKSTLYLSLNKKNEKKNTQLITYNIYRSRPDDEVDTYRLRLVILFNEISYKILIYC